MSQKTIDTMPLSLNRLAPWWQSHQPRRIILIGPSGAGKSTLAQKLASLLNSSVIELDELYWLPGWTGRPEAEFRAKVSQAVADDTWILAGNYQRTQVLSWPRAELVIWLDFPMPLVFSRVFRRCLRRALHREQICNGNTESLRMTFCSRQSLLLWILKTHASHRARYHQQMLQAGPPILRLRSPAEVKQLIELIWLNSRESDRNCGRS
ncbi:MAG: toxin [Candidatus Melainabacteria bacterium HGW-Melainabacteria-1]|nr:MAG: toxin [Candidatus Melainabacteria bacterium HGW-Melainabacteria-1]